MTETKKQAFINQIKIDMMKDRICLNNYILEMNELKAQPIFMREISLAEIDKRLIEAQAALFLMEKNLENLVTK